jgi:hypothetical protein
MTPKKAKPFALLMFTVVCTLSAVVVVPPPSAIAQEDDDVDDENLASSIVSEVLEDDDNGSSDVEDENVQEAANTATEDSNQQQGVDEDNVGEFGDDSADLEDANVAVPIGVSINVLEEVVEETLTPPSPDDDDACPVAGYTLSRGECTAEPTTTLTCEPSSVADIPVRRFDSTCEVAGPLPVITEEVCDEIEESTFTAIIPPPPIPRPPLPPLPPLPPVGVCTFPATETISCPGDVVPTEEGECITKPGRGNDPT